MIKCQFCEKECKNNNSHRNHERLCNSNPNKQITFRGGSKGKPGKNRFSKARELGLPVPKMTNEQKQKISKAVKERSPEWNKKNGLKISETINKKVEEGTWHTSLAKRMHYEYKGNDFHGTWELNYAKYLDSIDVNWKRNKTQFIYTFEGKKRRYTPDFFLPDTNEYIEIKGYKTKKDDAKWEQFPKDKILIILMKKDLENLKII